MSADSKLAVVTGGDAGLGRDMVYALAEQGWDVAISYVRDERLAAETTGHVRSLGRRAYSARADAGLKTDVDAFFDGVMNEFGRAPDVLINNAGVQTWSPLLDLQEAQWDQVIRTNLKGCFLNTQKAAQLMIQAGHGGAIVNIGSACNQVPFPKLVDYTASKGGIEQFTKVSAVELGPYGIRVNCVAPGAIETARTREEAPDYAGIWSRITPMRRVGTPRDVAHAVMFFVDPRSDFISGQTLFVDGAAFTVPNWPY
jgi:NAD(P)-dependent dehydrogenase (short-subunit alcohol dehydrogenase family)